MPALIRYVLHLFALLLLTLLLGACNSGPRLSSLPEEGVILAFGDSVTLGSGASTGHNYPDELARLSGHKVINAGVAGELSREGLARLPRMIEQYHPDMLVLIHGGNDILRKVPEAQTRHNLDEMIRVARARGLPVVMLSVPKLGVVLGSADFYQDLADAYDIPIDTEVLTQIYAGDEFRSSTIHPNDAGYRLIAESVDRLLRENGAL